MDCREEGNFKKSLAIWNESCWQRDFHIQNKLGRGTYLGCCLAWCLMGWECNYEGELYLGFMSACEVFRFHLAMSVVVVADSATLRTVAHQAPLSLGFSRQEYWSWVAMPPPTNLPDPEIEPESPTLQADGKVPSEPPGKPHHYA